LQLTNKIKERTLHCSCVRVSLVVADRGPCRDLPRKLPWEKTFRLAETKREATTPNQHGKSRVALDLHQVSCAAGAWGAWRCSVTYS